MNPCNTTHANIALMFEAQRERKRVVWSVDESLGSGNDQPRRLEKARFRGIRE
jgi:hypothetical protein